MGIEAVMADISTSANAAAEAHKASAGLPQLDFSLWPGQMVWALVIFTALYVVLAVLFLPRLRHAIHKRASAISEALAEARALRDEAEAQAKAAQAEITEARARAQKLAAEAKAKAKAQAAAREAEAEARLAGRLAESEARIRAARDQAMTHVRAIAEETASAMVTKLTGETPAPSEVAAPENASA
jgi:F-type H+-transporting ATPase subunit b